MEDAAKETVRSYETQIEERKKNDVEDTIRDHLRGFARTIPSFLMAYGTEDTTLVNFDQIVPDEVFQEVTSITLEQFRFLRDGGDYEDTATGETKHFDGKLFDEVVFDDSIKEFLRLKRELANYINYKDDDFLHKMYASGTKRVPFECRMDCLLYTSPSPRDTR